MPWQVLGLEKEGATERDVKGAYARLLKTHRPEEDPEGFQRVHDAYQQVLAELAWEKESGGHRGDAEMPDQVPAIEQAPPAFHEVTFDEEPFVEEAELPTLPVGLSEDIIKEIIRRQEPIVIKDVRVEDVLAHLERNDDAMPMRVLDAMLTEYNGNLRVELAEAILEQPTRFANEASVRFSIRLAMLLAFSKGHLAELLMNMLFQIVPAAQRNHVLAGPNFLLDIAPGFKGTIKRGHWDFWCAAITNPERIDWDSKLAGFALAEAERLGHWEGYDLLDSIVPEEKQLWNQRSKTRRRINPEARSRRPVERNSKSDYGILALQILCVFFLPAFLIFLFGAAGSCGLAPDKKIEHFTDTPVLEQQGWSPQTIGAKLNYANAEVRESMQTVHGEAQVFGTRDASGKLVYTAVIGKHTRQFEAQEFNRWQQSQRILSAASASGPASASVQRTNDQVQEMLKHMQRSRPGNGDARVRPNSSRGETGRLIPPETMPTQHIPRSLDPTGIHPSGTRPSRPGIRTQRGW